MNTEFYEFINFISSDMEDQIYFGEVWSANFLNDGVITKDFLQTGLVSLLIEKYQDQFQKELETRFAKEHNWKLYRHPQAQFIGIESVWNLLFPQMNESYKHFLKQNNPISKSALEARTRLYLLTKQFPPKAIYRILRYQESQYDWIEHDSNMDRADLSLFGYQTLDDWFGSQLVPIVAKTIINGSKIAKQRGYDVTKEEALLDLKENASKSFEQFKNNPAFASSNVNNYFNALLKTMGLRQDRAVAIWQDVLRFRRMLGDIGSSYFVDSLLFESYDSFVRETIVGDFYSLPVELQLKDFNSLQKLEVYLDLVSKRGKNVLALPESYYSIDEMKKSAPELLQKRYLVEIAKVDQKTLEEKVRIKEMWDWEKSSDNWMILQKKFPSIGIIVANDASSRINALDSMDPNSRIEIDQFARAEIVKLHPEWIEEALASAPVSNMTLHVPIKGKVENLSGIQDTDAFLTLLDQAPLNEYSKQLLKYSQDQQHFYRIQVKKRSKSIEIMTFDEAVRNHSLNKRLDQTLRDLYEKIKVNSPKDFQLADESFKSFIDVKDKVAESYCSTVLDQIRKESDDQKLTVDQCANRRFYSYFMQVKKDLQQGKDYQFSQLDSNQDTSFEHRKSIQSQWNLVKQDCCFDRLEPMQGVNLNHAFSLASDEWSDIIVDTNGNLSLLYVREKTLPDVTLSVDRIDRAHHLLGIEAKKVWFSDLLDQIQDSK